MDPDRSYRRTYYEPEQYDVPEEEDTGRPRHPPANNIYASTGTATRPTYTATRTNAYPTTITAPQMGYPASSRRSNMPSPEDYVPVYPVGGSSTGRTDPNRPYRYRQDSSDEPPQDRTATFRPPPGPPPILDNQRSRQDDARVDHRDLLEQLSGLSINPDPPAAESAYPYDSHDTSDWTEHRSGRAGYPGGPSRATREVPPALRARPDRLENRYPPPRINPREGDLTGYEPKDLSGRVILHRETYVAVGGFSTIWLGKWADPNYGPPGQYLALKAFSGSRLPGQSEKFKVRVRRETQNWHKMRHVNVLPLLGICNAPVDGIPDYPILVSHYCMQGNVNDYLRRYPQTPRGTIMGQVADGLTYLHEHGFVHGDLKGSNILIRDDGQACICDFGRTKLADEDYSKTLIGSAYWLAPELINHEGNQPLPITCESDMWALGMVVIEVFTGDRPWPGVRDFIVLQMVSSGATPRREEYRLIPHRVWNVIALCWERNPDSRPTIREFKADLLSAISSSGSYSTHEEPAY